MLDSLESLEEDTRDVAAEKSADKKRQIPTSEISTSSEKPQPIYTNDKFEAIADFPGEQQGDLAIRSGQILKILATR